MEITTKHQLDALFEHCKNGICPGAQVLIRQSGKTIYEECFGYANLENKVKITKDSIFHVASISKQFTVLAILLLWKAGKLDLEDKISDYVEDIVHIEQPITIHQMINNVSGLRDQWELLFLRGITITDAISMEDVNTSIRLQTGLNFPPQSDYLYSNTGFHLLAVIVERVSGVSFPRFVKEHIFEPLGMHHTFIRESYTQIVPNLVYSYQDDGDGNYYYAPLNYSLYGPTAVNTCASDLIRMLDEYISPKVIDPEIINFMKTPARLTNGSEIEYCGGLMTHKLYDLTVYGHGGADAAYRGQVSCIPEKELEIIILCNTTGRLVSKLAKKAACIILGLPDCTEPELPKETFCSARIGLFLTPAAEEDKLFVRITEENGVFYIQKEFCRTPLIAMPDGGYRINTLDEMIYFTDNGLKYRLPNRIVTLAPVEPAVCKEFKTGHYYNAETDAHLYLEAHGQDLSVRMLRYGSTPLYRGVDGTLAFSFGPDLCMYVTHEEGRLILDGYRVRGLSFQLITE